MKNLKGKTVFRRAFLFQSNSCYWKSAISGLLLFLFTNTLALAQTVNSFIADFFLFSGESTELIIEVTGTPEQLQNSYISAICVDCEGKVFFEDTSIPFTDEMIKGGQPIIITLPVKAFINVFWAEYWIEVKWHPGEPGSRKEPETVTVEDTISVEMICNIVKTESSAPDIQG